ncbi:MAG: hypothetical protein PVF49_11575 [Anaerolineales bacterium]|jgi:hypothetical protein
MENVNTLYPNIQRLAAQMRAQAGYKHCENCGASEAPPYVFAYGKKLSEDRSSVSTGSGTTTTTTTTYGSLDAKAVHLCDQCVASHRKEMVNRLWLVIAILGTLSLVLIVAAFLLPGDQILVTILATLMPFAVLFYGVKLHTTKNNADLPGLDLALKISKPRLQAEGYDSFWKDPDNPGSL